MIERFMQWPAWAKFATLVGIITLAFGLVYYTSGREEEPTDPEFTNPTGSAPTAMPSPDAAPSPSPSASTEPEPSASPEEEVEHGDHDHDETGVEMPSLPAEQIIAIEDKAYSGMEEYLTVKENETLNERQKRISKYISPESSMYNEDWTGGGIITSQAATPTTGKALSGNNEEINYLIQFTVSTTIADPDSGTEQIIRGEEEYEVTMEKVGDTWLIASYQEV